MPTRFLCLHFLASLLKLICIAGHFQGYVDPGPQIQVYEVFVVLGLLSLSALFSGLNLGLMSLDIVGLEIVEGSGTKTESKYARALRPLRTKGNFLLCTLLLGNTAVNAVLAIFLGSMTSGVTGTLVSTFAIVCFGEIIPQSLCSRYGLAIGYYTRFIVIFFMFLIGIIAWPISAYVYLFAFSVSFSLSQNDKFFSLMFADCWTG